MKTILSVDIGGTKTMASLYDFDLKQITNKKVFSDVSSQKNELSIVIDLIETMLSENNDEVVAIGIDTVGQVDTEKGIWYRINSQIGETIYLSRLLKEKFKIPVFVMNDVYAATYAELSEGLGKETDNFIYLNIGTGIAGRQVSEGHIINGASQYAGEFGHMVVDLNFKIQCTCGRYGCVESFASGLGMSNEAKRHINNRESSILKVDNNNRISVSELMKYYKNDFVANKVIDHAVLGLSALISNLIRCNDPKAIILGGGVTNSNELFEKILNSIDKVTTKNLVYGITRTSLDPNLVASIGAASYAKNHLR